MHKIIRLSDCGGDRSESILSPVAVASGVRLMSSASTDGNPLANYDMELMT